jgi:hypothetical protein
MIRYFTNTCPNGACVHTGLCHLPVYVLMAILMVHVATDNIVVIVFIKGCANNP